MPEANAPKPNTTTDKKNPKKDKGKPGQGRDFLVVDRSLRPDHVRQTMKKKRMISHCSSKSFKKI